MEIKTYKNDKNVKNINEIICRKFHHLGSKFQNSLNIFVLKKLNNFEIRYFLHFYITII